MWSFIDCEQQPDMANSKTRCGIEKKLLMYFQKWREKKKIKENSWRSGHCKKVKRQNVPQCKVK
jgi:hypothetical protein